MLVAINSNWKVTVSYFLINDIESKEKYNLLNACLDHLCHSEVMTKTLTFNGTSFNLSMINYMGASNPQFHSFFKTLWIRNDYAYFAESRSYVKIMPEHFERLETKFAFTWVRKYVWGIHIRYHKEKMKIFLAAQTFSSSVSDVLKYCSETLNSDSFKNCEPKIKQTCMSKYILPNQTIL